MVFVESSKKPSSTKIIFIELIFKAQIKKIENNMVLFG